MLVPTLDTWNPTQYERFKREREQPFVDLLALIRPAPSMRIIDLGCGTGHLTRLLHDRLQAAETVGVDRSARMLEAASTEESPGSRLHSIAACVARNVRRRDRVGMIW